MKSPKIIYLVTRAHGLRQHLLKTEDFLRVLDTKSLVEMVDFLSKTDYAPELSRIPSRGLDADRLEKIFYQKLSDRFAFLFLITSGSVRAALEDYYRRIEVENVKRVIRAAHGKEKITEDRLIPFPRRYQTVNFSALLEARTIREIVSLLRETPYKALAETIDLYERYQTTLVLEAQLDKIYYSSLWEKLRKIPDKRQVRELIGTEIDLKNLLYIFSFKHMKMEPDLAQDMMIDVHYKLPKSLIPQLIAAPQEAIPRLLTWPPYVELAEKAVGLLEKDMLTETEQAFAQHLYSYAETKALRNPNGLVYVFAYLLLCLRENKNLTTVAVGKQLRLEEEKIRRLLFP